MTNKKFFQFMFISIGMTICGFILLWLHYHPIFDGIKFSDFSYIPWLIVEFLIAFLLEFIMLTRKKNPWLFPSAFFLSNFGILIMGRMDNSLIIPQIRWVIIGMIMFFIIFRMEFIFKKLLNYKYAWGIFCLILCIITLLLGKDINGVLNSISIGSFRLQPLEISKILLIIFLASYFNDYESKKIDSFLLNCFILLFSISLFIFTKDFGNTLIFFFLMQILIYVKNGNKLHFLISTMIFILSMIISYFLFPDLKVFFDNWLNPWTNLNDTTKQTIESLFAISAGGVWGLGYTMGHSNLIFAAIAEEFGLIGIVSVIMIYVLFFYQSVLTAFNLKNESEIFLVYGVGILFFIQTFIVTCSAVNILPFISNNLPFMNYGGSATVSNFILLGILISFSRKEKYNE